MSSFNNRKFGGKKTVHGGKTIRELTPMGLGLEDIIDFSTNVSPLGPSAKVKEALINLDLSSYPDPECIQLREALAEKTGVNREQIIVGNGSTELIHLLARAYLGKESTAVILSPTFGEYETACRLARARVVFIKGKEEDGFVWDIAEVCRQILLLKPHLVYVCNPNNPTGVYLRRSMLQDLAAATDKGILVIDEAYISFVPRAWDTTTLLRSGNIVIMRSMTKDYALTALRLGYALCPQNVAESLCLNQPSWSVNAAAQLAGVIALSDQEHLIRTLQCIEQGRQYLNQQLEALGLSIYPSPANYVMVKTGNATEVRRKLLFKGFCVRDCTSFGLPEHIRLAVRTLPECQRLTQALTEVLRNDRIPYPKEPMML